jgi:hypothetical protein
MEVVMVLVVTRMRAPVLAEAAAAAAAAGGLFSASLETSYPLKHTFQT